MRINKNYILRNVGKKCVAVPVGEECRRFNGVININPTGKLIWESIAAGDTEDMTVAKMVEKYDVSAAHARDSYR
ncbi:MAG: PqqD family protein, partial [Clostridiales bacterium]|nr:PqqD family protein [Clostridiales bacterium]